MNLEEKLRQLKDAAKSRARNSQLDEALAYLQRVGQASRRPLPAERFSKGIEEYVEGCVQSNGCGEFFLAKQVLPFGRPYGKLRIGDVPTADLAPLDLFLPGARLPAPSRIAYLDTETTGLAGGTGTCAFLVGVGISEGSSFTVRQFFLRDYPEEKAMLTALTELLQPCEALVTFNGKTFDVPLLETRFALARLRSPLARLIHLDLLHPARRLWKLRLESCKLKTLESAILGIERHGDVDGADIPGIYFDYLRTGNARGLQPVFYHNALDIITLAALTVEMSGILADAGEATLKSAVDLFSLSRIYERSGGVEQSASVCQRALQQGLPAEMEAKALWQLAAQRKRQKLHGQAVELWIELTRRDSELVIAALEELAVCYEHRLRDHQRAIEVTSAALERLRGAGDSPQDVDRFARRLLRLQKKAAKGLAQQIGLGS
jgi:uncharacterized protein